MRFSGEDPTLWICSFGKRWKTERAQPHNVKLVNWEDFCQVFKVQIKAALCYGLLTNIGIFIKQNFTLTCDFATPFWLLSIMVFKIW